jgi:hypothetical protein
LRHVDSSDDLRAARKHDERGKNNKTPTTDLDQEHIASSSTYDPITDKGKRPVRDMADVYVSCFPFDIFDDSCW